MARQGRDLELIVARIESVLGPRGATITSPDYITDKVTGQSREVDAAIRYQIGSVPILITVECRDHNDPQDDTWLEQLVTKRQKVGAAKTIAVSSSGFTAPAVRDAQFHGIEVRTVDEITDDAILGWFQIKSIQNIVFRSEVSGVNVTMHGNTPGEPDWDSEWRKRMREDQLHTPAFESLEDGSRQCIQDWIKAAKVRSPKTFLDIPTDGTRIRKQLNLEFPPGMVRFFVVRGSEVKRVTVELDLFAETFEIPLGRVVAYTNDVNLIVYSAEAEAMILGEKLVLTVVRTPETKKIAIRVEPENRESNIIPLPGWKPNPPDEDRVEK
jgi:hypothetical protein